MLRVCDTPHILLALLLKLRYNCLVTESPGNLRYPGGYNVASTRHVSLSAL